MIWIGRLIFDWSIIVGGFVLVYLFGWWAVWPAAMLIGARIHALHEIAHIGSHRLIFRNKWDDVIARIVFLPQGIDLAKYRRFHLAHHRHLGDHTHDPESKIQQQFSDRWTKFRLIDTIKDSVGLTLDETYVVLRAMSTWQSITAMAVIIALAAAIIGPIALVWVVAMMTGLPAAHRLRAQTEHKHLIKPGTTLYKTQPPLWKRVWFLPHGVWQHYEHHNMRY